MNDRTRSDVRFLRKNTVTNDAPSLRAASANTKGTAAAVPFVTVLVTQKPAFSYLTRRAVT